MTRSAVSTPQPQRPDQEGPADGYVAAGGHPTHVHDFHQFLYVPIGRIVVTADGADHVLCPTVALWLPAGLPHSARFDPDSLVISESFDADRYRLPCQEASVVPVSEAQRRLLFARMRTRQTVPDDATVFAELTGEKELPLPLPRPTGKAARAVAGALLRDPADQRTATQWAEELHLSSTSLRRAFRTETGLAFSDWRTRVRLNRSLELLAEGHQVGVVAVRVGFVSTNGFILAFRRHFGRTPGAYVREWLDRAAG
uniref:helix-turn-helix transcriptional regulator n=1 Tax=Streptomyces chartreusis TaxID=1969 RepID=UPI003F495FE1